MKSRKKYLFILGSIIILLITLNSCSKKSKSKLDQYFYAHNSHNVDAAVSCFTDNASFQYKEGWTKTGKEKIRKLEEFWSATNSNFTLFHQEIKGDTVFCKFYDENDFYKNAGVEKVKYIARFTFQDKLIKEAILVIFSDSQMEIRKALKPFYNWALEKRPEEWLKLFRDSEFLYGYEGAKGWLKLLKEWREETQSGK